MCVHAAPFEHHANCARLVPGHVSAISPRMTVPLFSGAQRGPRSMMNARIVTGCAVPGIAPSVAVLENLHDAFHARDIARDLGHRILLGMADQTKQVDRAMHRRHIDAHRIETGQAGDVE